MRLLKLDYRCVFNYNMTTSLLEPVGGVYGFEWKWPPETHMALLEMGPCWYRCLVGKVYHWLWALWFQNVKPGLMSLFLPVAYWSRDVALSASSLAPCLPTCHHTCCHKNNRQNLWTVNQPQFNVFFYKSFCSHGVPSQPWKPKDICLLGRQWQECNMSNLLLSCQT